MQEKVQKISPIKQRILQFVDTLGISKRDFYAQIGVSRGTLESKTGITEDVMAKFIATYPDISTDWLVTGNGEILKNAEQPDLTIFNTKYPENTMLLEHGKKHGIMHGFPKVQKTPCFGVDLGSSAMDVTLRQTFPLRTDRLIDRQQIPIYDMEAVAGLVSLFAGDYSQQVIEVVETGLIPKCDGGLRIVGDSMYPLLKSGDVVFYKQIHDILNNIVWGEMYLVSFDIEGEEYVSVKYIKKSQEQDHVQLVSYNEHHSPMDIPISRIHALAFVKASLRLNTIR